MASIAAHVGIPDRFVYSTAKGAVMAMTLSIAKDYLQENIRCNSISPARVHTPFVDGFLKNSYPGKEEEMFDKLSKTQPIGRMGTPEEIAGLALYLCSDEALLLRVVIILLMAALLNSIIRTTINMITRIRRKFNTQRIITMYKFLFVAIFITNVFFAERNLNIPLHLKICSKKRIPG
jgi:Dehydrogenases with different specificities (related to short-chain alcohol dehydrogenases)